MTSKLAPVKITLDQRIALMLALFITTEAQGNHDFSNMLTVEGRKEMMRIAQSILDQVTGDTAEIEILKKHFLSDN